MTGLEQRRPKFCPHCGTPLPPGAPRFCVECGAPTGHAGADEPEAHEPAASTGPTVRLPNARVEQQVVGGTVRLPSSGAVPPGLWDRDVPPGPAEIVALYAPLRAVSKGWSGQIGRGWHTAGSATEGDTTVFLFRAAIRWFPAEGCGAGLQLAVEIEASSHSSAEGRERRGFRFGLRRDGPMRVISAEWRDADDNPVVDQPLPQIQLMAPPRVPRLRDLAERPELLDARAAAEWVSGSQAAGAYRSYYGQLYQEHTPVGRGCTLIPLSEPSPSERLWWRRLLAGQQPERFRVRLEQPFSCQLDDWPGQLGRIREQARALGLDLDPATAAEWWLDRNGHDGAIFTGAQGRYGAERVVIIFRYSQLAKLRD